MNVFRVMWIRILIIFPSFALQACAEAAVHFAIDQHGNICTTLQRSFSSGLHPAQLDELTATAQKVRQAV